MRFGPVLWHIWGWLHSCGWTWSRVMNQVWVVFVGLHNNTVMICRPRTTRSCKWSRMIRCWNNLLTSPTSRTSPACIAHLYIYMLIIDHGVGVGAKSVPASQWKLIASKIDSAWWMDEWMDMYLPNTHLNILSHQTFLKKIKVQGTDISASRPKAPRPAAINPAPRQEQARWGISNLKLPPLPFPK